MASSVCKPNANGSGSFPDMLEVVTDEFRFKAKSKAASNLVIDDYKNINVNCTALNKCVHGVRAGSRAKGVGRSLRVPLTIKKLVHTRKQSGIGADNSGMKEFHLIKDTGIKLNFLKIISLASRSGVQEVFLQAWHHISHANPIIRVSLRLKHREDVKVRIISKD
ncbi:conserved hypothetical protein [Ricinus communis]|uniref:Uncharacterized protein n=1 Tax=Ricinus communis TaxID=3988 RepID=B9RL38_RICCO|nr:conserved hypothetical protein [Ricinus communis]